MLDVDPVGLVRRRRGVCSFVFAEYVNDRPYVASSFLSVALVNVLKGAMAGTCRGYEELAASAIPQEAWLPAVPARGGERRAWFVECASANRSGLATVRERSCRRTH